MSNLPSFVTEAVDEYISLHQQVKEMEKRMAELKEAINPFIEVTDRLQGSKGSIVRQVSNRPVMNAEYTSYELDDIKDYITPSIKRIGGLLVTRVAAKNLELLVEAGKLPAEILSFKKVNVVKSIVVRK